MKKKLFTLLFALAFVSTAAVAETEGENCWQAAPEDASNPLLQIITFPFKLVYTVTTLPRCLVASIPKNK